MVAPHAALAGCLGRRVLLDSIDSIDGIDNINNMVNDPRLPLANMARMASTPNLVAAPPLFPRPPPAPF